MVVATLGFAAMSGLVKLAGARIPSSEIVVVGAVVTLVVSAALLARAGVSPLGVDRKLLFLRGLVGAIALQLFFFALTTLPLAEATVIQFLSPLVVAVGAWIFFREPLGRPEIAALALGLVGVLMVARPGPLAAETALAGPPLDPVGLAAGLTAAVLGAGAYLIVRRLRLTEQPLVVVLWFPIVALPVALPIAIPVWVWPTPTEWLVLLGVGLATQVGQMKMTEALHLAPAARVGAVSYLQVLWATLLGLVAFGETPSALALGGALAIGAGTVIVARRR